MKAAWSDTQRQQQLGAHLVADGIKQILDIIGDIDIVIKSVAAAQSNYGSLHHADTPLPSLPNVPFDTPR
jgi:hypothetical protein